MNHLCVLHVATEYAPLTGHTPGARETLYLARALGAMGIELTITVPARAIGDLAGSGLAKRLDPLTGPDGLTATIYEGWVPGGRARIYAIEAHLEAGDAASDEVVGDEDGYCRAALELVRQHDIWPHLIRAEPATAATLALAADSDLPTPASILTLSRAPDPAALDAALAAARPALPDRVAVPSPALAAHLAALPDDDPLGAALAPVRDRLIGLVPGVDRETWNPRRDDLGAPGPDTRADKEHRKRALRRELGLRPSARTPLLVAVGPFDRAVLSGVAIEAISRAMVQIIACPTTGDAGWIRAHMDADGSRAAVYPIDPGDPRSRDEVAKLLCAADLALIPRLPWSPLNDLHCLHYGAIPIAPRHGVCADLLAEFDPGTATGTGFLFDPGDPDALGRAVKRAIRAYAAEEAFATLVDRAMGFAMSWRDAARRHANLYRELVTRTAVRAA